MSKITREKILVPTKLAKTHPHSSTGHPVVSLLETAPWNRHAESNHTRPATSPKLSHSSPKTISSRKETRGHQPVAILKSSRNARRSNHQVLMATPLSGNLARTSTSRSYPSSAQTRTHSLGGRPSTRRRLQPSVTKDLHSQKRLRAT